MARGRKRFARKKSHRSYRKLFIIAVEGAETELRYFDWFRRLDDTNFVIQVACPKCNDGKSAPGHVLKRMEKRLERESLKASDEAWLVVDRDKWRDEQLTDLYR